MSKAPPEFSVQVFLKTLDNSPLGLELKGRYPDLFRRLETFRREMGDNCNYTKACLQVLWVNEVARDSHGFYQSLRAAGY